MDCHPPLPWHIVHDLNYSPSISNDRGLDLKYHKQWQNILVFPWVALSWTPRELHVDFLLGEVVVGICRYINKRGHPKQFRLIVTSLLNKRWSLELIQVCISLYLSQCHRHNDLTQLYETEGQFFWRLTIFNLDLFDIRTITNHDREKCLLQHNLFYMSILYAKNHNTFYSDT